VIPIQEDETALVLWALWHHYDRYRDIEFAHGVYDKLIASCGDFLVHFRDPKTGLPSPSWNLWEDRYGVHTFTCATVVAGLNAASNFAKLFADSVRMDLYRKVAAEVRDAMTKYLYSSELNRFVRSLIPNDNGYEADATIDASLLSVSWLECFPADVPVVTSTVDAVRGTLSAGGGLARFESDGYMRTDASTAGNAWFICTLWLADHLIRAAREPADLTEVKSILEWVVDHARPSGVMSEQIDPVTGEQVSVSPLTWSHSTFVSTICSYRDKMRALETLGH
jgi:GH15 family glucan-1,4-alpha-glucosidase